MKENLLLFDGVCHLCQGVVQFILPRNKKENIYFGSLQSKAGKAILSNFDLGDSTLDTVIYIEEGRIYKKSTAALHIAKHLGGFWPLLIIFLAIPRPIRDSLYDLVARNRYRWFGKSESCMLPRPEWKQRFMEDEEDV